MIEQIKNQTQDNAHIAQDNVRNHVLIEIEKNLAHIKTSFLSPSALVKIGLFGNTVSALNALRNGEISSTKVSDHRTLIAKEDVLEFIRRKSK